MDRDVYTHTLQLLNAYFEGSYNPGEYVSERIEIPQRSMAENIKSVFRRSKVFVTSDLRKKKAECPLL